MAELPVFEQMMEDLGIPTLVVSLMVVKYSQTFPAPTPEELKGVPKMPGSLDEALECLRKDHAFLLKGDVFTEELLEAFIDYKRKNEADSVRLRPHPYEFALYYDI